MQKVQIKLSLLNKFIGSFLKNTQGLAATEFALLLPAMITAYMGTVEISRAYIAKNKVEIVAETIADLVSRGQTISAAELTDMFDISTQMLNADQLTTFNVAVTAVRTEPAPSGGSETKVTWSESKTGENTYSTDSDYNELPPGMAQNYQTIIVTELYFQHNSLYGYFFTSGARMDRRIISRPRYSSDIPCSDCS